VSFLNDSVALVANPGLETVTPVNVRSGALGADIAVGGYPQAGVTVDDTVFILNAELGPDFQPSGPGTVSVIADSPARVVKTITLGGTNPGAAAVGPGGRVYVINSGRFGLDEGTVSVLDRGSLAEVAHRSGFGSFPGSIAVGSDNRVYVGGFGIGVLVWDAQTSTFVRGAADPVAPGGEASTSGLGIDSAGRLYALEPDCQAPGSAYRLSGALAVEETIPAGICPIAIAFSQLGAPLE
jgi:hypothetical protein